MRELSAGKVVRGERMICGECKYSKRDWTNPQNTDYYCSNEYSDAYGCNTMYTDGCEEGEPNE